MGGCRRLRSRRPQGPGRSSSPFESGSAAQLPAQPPTKATPPSRYRRSCRATIKPLASHNDRGPSAEKVIGRTAGWNGHAAVMSWVVRCETVPLMSRGYWQKRTRSLQSMLEPLVIIERRLGGPMEWNYPPIANGRTFGVRCGSLPTSPGRNRPVARRSMGSGFPLRVADVHQRLLPFAPIANVEAGDPPRFFVWVGDR
jgi:hypothetical protein